jgi:hypothetical protein
VKPGSMTQALYASLRLPFTLGVANDAFFGRTD